MDPVGSEAVRVVSSDEGYRPGMLLTPRYEGPAILRIEGTTDDVSVPLLRQRRRLGELLAELDDDQWAAQSRCEAWSVRDVVAHLVGTDQFWFLSAQAALAGEPTRFLTAFDPVATPAQMVDHTRDTPPADLLASYRAGVEAFGGVLSGLDDERWEVPAEAPPGHIALRAMAHHALWDAWVHERDIVLPLGLAPVEEVDEMQACLRYAACLGPAFAASTGSQRPGTLAVVGTDPTATVVVQAGETVVGRDGDAPEGAVRLEGRTADLVEALSFRAPFPHDVPEDDRWLVAGLAVVFDLAPS